jgi:beta-N-acetylhexosaminidase
MIPLLLSTLLFCCARPASASPLTLEEKAGQVMMIAVDTAIAASAEPDIRAGRIGGVMLRWDKFTGPEAFEFNARLQGWARCAAHPVPLLVASDHEGGPVFTQRLYGGAVFPGNMALGAAGSQDLAREAARASARELRALGIGMDFAPVLDVNSNPANPIIGARSFGEDPAEVSRLGLAAVRGYMEGGVLPVVKHWPGHGDSADDSHLGLPVVGKSLAELEEAELVPFRAAIARGAPVVMPAHVLFPALDPARPVTLSSAAIEGTLRGKMGFKGLVVSDSLDMGAVAGVASSSEAAVMAFQAGCDVLMLGKADYKAIYAHFLEALRQGRISEERLDRSVERVLKAKGMIRPDRPPFSEVGKEENLRLASKNDEGLLPLRLPKDKKIFLLIARTPRFADESRLLCAEISARHENTRCLDMPFNPGGEASRHALDMAREADILLLGGIEAQGLQVGGQTALLQELLLLGKPSALLCLWSPYQAGKFPQAKAVLCLYGPTATAMKAAARLVFGEIRPRGRLPVTIPGLFPRGAGMRRFKP